MLKYRRKTTPIDAFQWDGEDPDAPSNPGWFKDLTSGNVVKKRPEVLVVKTTKGSSKVGVNDWVILDKDGNVDVVSDAQFSANYKVIT